MSRPLIVLVTALALTACQTNDYGATRPVFTETEYLCSTGERLTIRFFPLQGVAVLLRAGKSYELQQEPAASGFAYRGQYISVRGKGLDLRYEFARMAPIECRATQ